MRTPLPIFLCACEMTSSALTGDVHLCASNKSRMAGWVFMKFVVDVVPF
jgi:hypothetical protein